MIALLRAAALLLVAALVQVSGIGGADIAGVVPGVLLAAVVLLGWHRGALAGAVGGFSAGLLVDTVTLDRLGVTSLLLLLAGYWAGRYAETTGRGRAYSPYLAVFLLTIAVAVCGLGLVALLGDTVDAGRTFAPLLPAAALNAALAFALHRPIRAILGRSGGGGGAAEVETVG
jgi:rod shape-determining protein MreD